MYYIFAWGLTFVLPALSALAEGVLYFYGDLTWLLAKWFVFWGIGIRLVMAGARQILNPAFTAKTIFQCSDPQAAKLVIEIGFGNIAIGTVAALSLLVPSLTAAAGLAGGIFMALAGLQHVRNSNRNAHENTALMTDILVAFIVLPTSIFLLLR